MSPRLRVLPVPLVLLLALFAAAPASAAPGDAALASTYLGGSAVDVGVSVDVAADGDVYVVGVTESADFPQAGGVTPRAGDVFVAKLDPQGSQLLWARVIGGGAYDEPAAVRAASDGVYVAGTTASPDFPTQGNIVFDDTFAGTHEGFLLKLDLDGATQWSTFLGGAARDVVGDLDLAPGGKVVVAGHTHSCDFFVSDDAVKAPPTGCTEQPADAFVSRFWPDGAMHRSTLFGGSIHERSVSIAVDGVSGAILIAGDTTSSDLPMVGSPYQTRPDDMFVAKFDDSLRSVAYTTFLGGAEDDERAGGIARDRSGHAYVSGITYSTDYPTTPGAHQTSHQSPTQCGGPCGDAFVTKLAPDGSELVWSTFLGGASDDQGEAVQLGADESVWVAGGTRSTASFLDGGSDGGSHDGFVAVLAPAGDHLQALHPLRGSSSDIANDLRVISGIAWSTGITWSSDYPTTPGAYDSTRGGANDAFLTAFDADDTPPVLTFDHHAGNEWWVEAVVSGASVAAVQARDDGSEWKDLEAKSWGTWGASFHIEPGHRVQFRALSQAQWVESCWFTHPQGVEECADDPDGFDATFLHPRGNDWWVEVDVSANQPITRVEVQLNGGQPEPLSKTSWGSWAESMHAPSGTLVRFIAWGSDAGESSASGCYRWTTAEPASCPSTASPLFDHKTGNEWWVEVIVTQRTPDRVQAMAADGDWIELTLRDWGAWAASFHIEPGSDVRFQALVEGAWHESCWFSHPAGDARTGGTTCPGTAV